MHVYEMRVHVHAVPVCVYVCSCVRMCVFTHLHELINVVLIASGSHKIFLKLCGYGAWICLQGLSLHPNACLYPFKPYIVHVYI